jgi:ATP/maltotriose-dependent transcriptional regulator MalT
VYRKLDVTDRREAVRRGRELHLLSPGLGER